MRSVRSVEKTVVVLKVAYNLLEAGRTEGNEAGGGWEGRTLG